jgi:hypothetical protein
MDHSSNAIETHRRQSIRRELEVSLDGEARSNARTSEAYHAAFAWLRQRQALSVLRTLDEREIVFLFLDSTFDRLPVANSLTSSNRAYRDVRVSESSRQIVFLGCCSTQDTDVDRDLIDLLDDGAVIISSDKSAELPVLRGFLAPERPSPPRRARVAIDDRCEMAEVLASLQMLPAVRLAAGHVPLTHAAMRTPDARLLAVDKLTGDPIAVAIPILRGWVIHSSAHWWQDACPDLTETGDRLLLSTPAYRNLGRAFPTVALGDFHAAVAMLCVLERGLRIAFPAAGALKTDRPAGQPDKEHGPHVETA